MKTFTESTRPTKLAQELTKLDSETIARIFLSVLQTRKDSAILDGIGNTLSTRLELLKDEADPEQEELF